MEKPNLFIIGAMKSGTTSLHNYLKHHSKIFMSEPKELWYFVEEKNWYKGESWYLKHFKNAHDFVYVGESSADYTMYPTYKGVPQKIYEFNPEAKLIYIMRDPVQRTISHYWHDVRFGFQRQNIQKALKTNNSYIDYSKYSLQLSKYFNYFRPEQIFTATTEEMKSNVDNFVKNIIAWLGLDPADYDTSQLKKKYNVTPNQVQQAKGLGYLHSIRGSKLWDQMRPFAPEFLIKAGHCFAYRNINKNEKITSEVIDYIKAKLEKDTTELSLLLGKNFPEWSIPCKNVAP